MTWEHRLSSHGGPHAEDGLKIGARCTEALAGL